MKTEGRIAKHEPKEIRSLAPLAMSKTEKKGEGNIERKLSHLKFNFKRIGEVIQPS